jgi:hypothetical protein
MVSQGTQLLATPAVLLFELRNPRRKRGSFYLVSLFSPFSGPQTKVFCCVENIWYLKTQRTTSARDKAKMKTRLHCVILEPNPCYRLPRETQVPSPPSPNGQTLLREALICQESPSTDKSYLPQALWKNWLMDQHPVRCGVSGKERGGWCTSTPAKFIKQIW